MSAQDDLKVIIKNDCLPGVDLAKDDYSMLASFPPSWTVVTKTMWKSNKLTYIGVRQFVNEGDVIEVGNLSKKYRVMSLVKNEGIIGGKGGMIFQIKRVDGNLTTQTDLDNVKVGKNVRILGRKNFIDTLDHKLGRDLATNLP